MMAPNATVAAGVEAPPTPTAEQLRTCLAHLLFQPSEEVAAAITAAYERTPRLVQALVGVEETAAARDLGDWLARADCALWRPEGQGGGDSCGWLLATDDRAAVAGRLGPGAAVLGGGPGLLARGWGSYFLFRQAHRCFVVPGSLAAAGCTHSIRRVAGRGRIVRALRLDPAVAAECQAAAAAAQCTAP